MHLAASMCQARNLQAVSNFSPAANRLAICGYDMKTSTLTLAAHVQDQSDTEYRAYGKSRNSVGRIFKFSIAKHSNKLGGPRFRGSRC